MLAFPESLDVDAGEGKVLHFHIIRVCPNVLAIQENLHALKTDDDLIFGYIVFADGYIYAYSAIPKATSSSDCDYRLIFMAYMGPESKLDDADPNVINHIFHGIGVAFVQLSRFDNKHPAFVDRDTFMEVYHTLQQSLAGEHIGPMTSYIEPMLALATELESFYHSMAENLTRLNEEKTTPPTKD